MIQSQKTDWITRTPPAPEGLRGLDLASLLPNPNNLPLAIFVGFVVKGLQRFIVPILYRRSLSDPNGMDLINGRELDRNVQRFRRYFISC